MILVALNFSYLKVHESKRKAFPFRISDSMDQPKNCIRKL